MTTGNKAEHLGLGIGCAASGFHFTLSISVISYYEIMRGIKALSNINKINLFNEFMADCNIEVVDSMVANKASEIYDVLRKNGQLLEDADILIAATAINKNMVLVSDNIRHFKRINELELKNWFKLAT